MICPPQLAIRVHRWPPEVVALISVVSSLLALSAVVTSPANEIRRLLLASVRSA
jgi:hypothetical protein